MGDARGGEEMKISIARARYLMMLFAALALPFPGLRSRTGRLLCCNNFGEESSALGVGGTDPLSAKLAQAAVGYQLAALFIPEAVGERSQAGEQGDRLHTLEQRIGTVAAFQVVVRNARAQMVNVVEPDVA